MSAFSGDSLNKLLELQKQELDALTEIHALAKAQFAIIKEEDTDKLNENIDLRQRIMDGVDRLHQELSVLMQSYTSAASNLPSDTRRAVTEQKDRISSTLRDIAAEDAKNREAVKAKMGEYSGEAKKLSLGRKSISAYNQADYVMGSGYFDEKK